MIPKHTKKIVWGKIIYFIFREGRRNEVAPVTTMPLVVSEPTVVPPPSVAFVPTVPCPPVPICALVRRAWRPPLRGLGALRYVGSAPSVTWPRRPPPC